MRAAVQGIGSDLYHRYSCKLLLTLSSNNRSCRGCFDNLVMLVGFGYDPNQPNINELLSLIFVFSEEDEKQIDRVSFNSGGNSLSLLLKKRHMVSYLAKLAYDLSICLKDNVSTSGGFEATGLWRQK